jgi:hypothetical protein
VSAPKIKRMSRLLLREEEVMKKGQRVKDVTKYEA